MSIPPFPVEVIPHLNWDLRLKPHEYWEMDVQDWHTARAVQAAYRDGEEAARHDREKRERQEQEAARRQAALRGAIG